jgi:aspartate aminotransferase
MTYLNKKIINLPASATLAVKTRATELRAQGVNIIDLSAGEPDIDTPEHIKEAAIRALHDGKTKYTPVPGTLACREAIAKKLTEDNGIATSAAAVVVTNGGKQALSALFDSCLESGDEVIVPAPYWVSYVPMVELAGGTAVVVQTEASRGYKLSPEALKSVITPRTKMFIMNSPSNPTGAAYTAAEMKELAAVLLDTNILIVSDEVYEKITYGDFRFTSFAAAVPDLADRTVTINALSKTYSMTGWRVGYATGPETIIKAMGKLQGQTTSNVCSIAQEAAIAALQGSHDFLVPLVESYARRTHMAVEAINAIEGLAVPVMPEGAFYLFVRIEDYLDKNSAGIKSSVELAAKLLESGVAVVPGEAFGDPGAFRISVSLADDVLRQGIERIKEGIQATM